MKANDIKAHFRAMGIPVRVRTVQVKNPFAQVWIECRKGGNVLAPMVYDFEFPLAMRQKLLRIVYGADCSFAERGDAGNVRPHSLSFNANEWAQLIS